MHTGTQTTTTSVQMLGTKVASSEEEAIGSFIRDCIRENPGYKAGFPLMLSVPLGDIDTKPSEIPEPKWVVNDLAELGVEIQGKHFFLYKGGSIVYKDGLHENGTPMHVRPVGKREFGETCKPVLYDGKVHLSDSDEWKPLVQL